MIQLRVLHIMPGFGGGISSHVRNIIRGVDKEKIIIDVASFTDYPDFFIEEVKAKGGQTFHLRNVRVKSIMACVGEYISILRTNKYDAVHLHLTDFQAAYFSMLSRLCGVHRVIVHAHIADQPNTSNPLVRIKYECFKFMLLVVKLLLHFGLDRSVWIRERLCIFLIALMSVNTNLKLRNLRKQPL